MADAGTILGEARDIVFFFEGMFDPASGETVCPLINEVRSVYHPDFMRPLVNRWPNVDQPVFV